MRGFDMQEGGGGKLTGRQEGVCWTVAGHSKKRRIFERNPTQRAQRDQVFFQ